MSDDLKKNLKARTTWERGAYMLLFIIIFNIAELLISAVVIFQFLHTLITGKNNEQLLSLGYSLSTFVSQVVKFITYNSETRPYPFGNWPRGKKAGRSAKKEIEPRPK